MQSLELKQALLQDPIAERVFEEHGVSPSVLLFAEVEIGKATKIASSQHLHFIVNASDLETKDTGEIAHELVHLIDDLQDRNPELFITASNVVEDLDYTYFEEIAQAKSLLEVRAQLLPEYLLCFSTKKAAHSYFTRMTKIAEKIALHKISFNEDEKRIMNMVRTTALETDSKAYLVGGVLRDKLLGEQNNDLDFMVVTDDLEGFITHLTTKYDLREPVKLERSQAYTLHVDDFDIDIIDARKVYTPMRPEFKDSLEEDDDWSLALDDIFRRDLTINSLSYDLINNKVLDPTKQGLSDLANGIVRTIVDPYVKYRINAFDMLRALRFAAVYDFKLGPDMLEAMRKNAERISPRNLGGDVSNRRILRELRKAASSAESWYRMKKYLAETGLVDYLIESIDKVEAQRTSFSGGEEEKELTNGV